MLNYRPIKEALLSFSLSLFALLFAILLPFMRSMSDRHIRIYIIQENVFKFLYFFLSLHFEIFNDVSSSRFELSLFLFSLVEIGIYIHMKFALMMMVVMMLMCFDQHLNLRVMCASLLFLMKMMMMMMMIDEIMRLKATLIEKKLNHRFFVY